MNKTKNFSTLASSLALAAVFSLAAQHACQAQTASSDTPVSDNSTRVIAIDYNLPVFKAHRAQEIVNAIKSTVSRGLCAGSVRDILDSSGVIVPLGPHGEKPKASDYGQILPQIGFVSLETGEGPDFNVDEVRQDVSAAFGDPNHPVVVVMYDVANPSAAGHIFYIDEYNETTSDFKQFSGTGLIRPQDFTYEVFVYDGPVSGYNVRPTPVFYANRDESVSSTTSFGPALRPIYKNYTTQISSLSVSGTTILDLK